MARFSVDAIVVGCGGFGSAALYHLARRGLKVAGLEQFTPPHDRGSSHGQTRIIRKAYFEHPNYVPLLHRAWDLWLSLQSESGRSLLLPRPLLMSGPPGSPVIDGARTSAELHGLPLDSLSAQQARQRYPMFSVPDDHSFTLEHSAGILFCEACIAEHLSLAADHGAVLHANETVRHIEWTQSSVTVTTDTDVWSAAAAVVTAGAWTGQLLPAYQPLIQIVRKPIFWHPALDACWTAQDAPMFLLDLPEGQFYGLPSIDGTTIKVGEHTGGDVVQNPNCVSREITLQDRMPVSQFVTHRLRDVGTTATSAAVCMYSMSPDGHFLFDRLPDGPVVVAAGFSGHGFKFTSVLGEAAADLIVDGSTALPIEFLSQLRLPQFGAI